MQKAPRVLPDKASWTTRIYGAPATMEAGLSEKVPASSQKDR